MSEAPAHIESPPKAISKYSPLKKRHEVLGYIFGQPLESFEKLLEVQPSTSATTTNQTKIKPTDSHIIRHWMHLDKNNGNLIGIVTDNLIDFYQKYHPSVKLR